MNFLQAVAAARRVPVSPGGIVTSGLIWHIDPTDTASYPGTGSTIYDLVGSNNGTFQGGTYVDGSGHIRLDGVNDAVNFGSISTSNAISIGASSFTLQGWGYGINSGDNFMHLYSQYGSGNIDRVIIFLYRPQTRAIAVLWSGSTGQTTPNNGANTSFNAWRMYTMTYDNSTGDLSIYIDTTQDTPIKTGISAPNSVTRSFRLGARGTSLSNNEWNGRIGAFMHYNRVLSAAEISQNYNATKADYGL